MNRFGDKEKTLEKSKVIIVNNFPCFNAVKLFVSPLLHVSFKQLT